MRSGSRVHGIKCEISFEGEISFEPRQDQLRVERETHVVVESAGGRDWSESYINPSNIEKNLY